jgi:uncharacterized membrane protein YqiK
MQPILIVLAAIGIGFVLLAGLALLVKNFYRKVLPGQALVNNKTGALTEVSFTGSLVLPIIHRAEVMDISVKKIEVDRMGKDGLICKDNIRADIKVTFFVRVNPTQDDVKKVAMSIGCARASDQRTLEQLFLAKFSEALKTVGYQMGFVELYTERDTFKQRIIDAIGKDLNGYVLEDSAIDYLEQTPVDILDPENILDSEGIRAITAITAEKAVETNRLKNDEQKRIKKQDVEAKEAILALERQQAVAEAAQAREIATVRAREKATIEKEQAAQTWESEQAKIKTTQEIEVARRNQQREVGMAEKNRDRVLLVETERVEKERVLEVISRERETELNRIEKDKALEKEKKEIADVVRMRVAVDKTVAEEEERIKDLRVGAEANRQRDVKVIGAEAEAQEKLVKDIKAAEAAEKAAGHQAKQRLILADAELEAADREAKAKIRKADGVKAEVAAPGLAEVTVKEADAVAIEKKGMVEARVTKEKLFATAEGEKAQGMATVEVQEAAANVERQKMTAIADGEKSQGLARANVKEVEAAAVEKYGVAEAVAIRERGVAEAKAIEEKLTAEAKGLLEKADAMKQLDGVGREHEEFRIRLEKDKAVELEGIEAQRQIAEAQARVMGEAFKNTKIDIVGGDGQFFDKFIGAVGMGKSVDGFVNKSDVNQALIQQYLDGGRSLPEDITQILSRPALGSGDVSKLTVSAFLASLMSSAEGAQKTKLGKLIEEAKKLGFGE